MAITNLRFCEARAVRLPGTRSSRAIVALEEAATGLLNRHRQSRGRKSAHEKALRVGVSRRLFVFIPPVGRSTFCGLASQGAPGLVMLSSTCSYISAVTLLLQCTSGNAVLAQEGQATTATASANDRGDACAQSIEKVINLCMIRGLNNIGRVNCDCVQDGPKWTCTGTATCAK
jgi:hypothetical protein